MFFSSVGVFPQNTVVALDKFAVFGHSFPLHIEWVLCFDLVVHLYHFIILTIDGLDLKFEITHVFQHKPASFILPFKWHFPQFRHRQNVWPESFWEADGRKTSMRIEVPWAPNGSMSILPAGLVDRAQHGATAFRSSCYSSAEGQRFARGCSSRSRAGLDGGADDSESLWSCGMYIWKVQGERMDDPVLRPNSHKTCMREFRKSKVDQGRWTIMFGPMGSGANIQVAIWQIREEKHSNCRTGHGVDFSFQIVHRLDVVFDVARRKKKARSLGHPA